MANEVISIFSKPQSFLRMKRKCDPWSNGLISIFQTEIGAPFRNQRRVQDTMGFGYCFTIRHLIWMLSKFGIFLWIDDICIEIGSGSITAENYEMTLKYRIVENTTSSTLRFKNYLSCCHCQSWIYLEWWQISITCCKVWIETKVKINRQSAFTQYRTPFWLVEIRLTRRMSSRCQNTFTMSVGYD